VVVQDHVYSLCAAWVLDILSKNWHRLWIWTNSINTHSSSKLSHPSWLVYTPETSSSLHFGTLPQECLGTRQPPSWDSVPEDGQDASPHLRRQQCSHQHQLTSSNSVNSNAVDCIRSTSPASVIGTAIIQSVVASPLRAHAVTICAVALTAPLPTFDYANFAYS
jgi:hypothetical protein